MQRLQFFGGITKRPRRYSSSWVVFATLGMFFVPVSARADDIVFDVEMLKARGVDPQVARIFLKAPRFLSGESAVTFKVNGVERGRVKVQFDQDGNACADQVLLKAVGLLPPTKLADEAGCISLADAWPQTELQLDPTGQRVNLVVPAQFVTAPAREQSDWKHGGLAGMLNYDLQHVASTGASAALSFSQVDTETGFNINDWIVRSRQSYTQLNGESRIQHQSAFAQRSFVESKQVLRAGQISLSNSMFGAGRVYGFQVFPESALHHDGQGPGLVEGIADSQAVVEVRQSGVLVHSTTVPAGPFRLQGFSVLNTRSDLEVTLTGTDGSKHSFIVPAASLLRGGSSITPGLSYGAGRLDQDGSSQSPVVATAAMGWQLTPRMAFNSGVLASTPYRAAAVNLDTRFSDGTQLSVRTTAMQDNRHGGNGLATTASLSYNLTERLSLGLNVLQHSLGYRELSETLQDEPPDAQNATRRQVGTGINWSSDQLGGLGVFWSRSQTFAGERRDFLRGSWSRSFAQSYVGLSVERDMGTRNSDPQSRIYLSVSIPFGGGGSSRSSLSSFASHSSSGTRIGSSLNHRFGRDRGVALRSDHDMRTKRTSSTLSGDLLTPISQLNASVSHDSDGNGSWSGRASGAVVAHENGITLSPYRVNDTFGIAKVGDESGVRLVTSAGPVWTDANGYAVLPSLQGFKRSTVQVETSSLPRNVDISNAWQSTEAARGSVNKVNFEVVRTRRVMVQVRGANGKPLQTGASVFDEVGNFLTVVDGKGAVFVPDASSVKALEVQSAGRTLCSFSLSLPDKPESDKLFETASAVCR